MIAKTRLDKFIETINKLYEFLHIFKSDLMGIEIDKKENGDFWMCDLVMVYDSYKIHAEFESTGIKKLIKLFVYVREMVRGGIVFIDEFDSNLHDVYLCALLEYLMEYGEGQLCFTKHMWNYNITNCFNIYLCSSKNITSIFINSINIKFNFVNFTNIINGISRFKKTKVRMVN